MTAPLDDPQEISWLEGAHHRIQTPFGPVQILTRDPRWHARFTDK